MKQDAENEKLSGCRASWLAEEEHYMEDSKAGALAGWRAEEENGINLED